MSRPVRVADARLALEDTPFRSPLKFGGRVVAASQLLNVTVTIEAPGGRRADGFGSMPLGNVWGWPSASVEPPQSAEAVRRVAEAVVRQARDCAEAGHPLDLVTALEHDWQAAADAVTEAMGLPERMPTLMTLVAASPLDAAVHDAYGKLHGRNVYDCYGPEFVSRDLSAWLGPEFAGEYLDRYTSRAPRPWMPLYHLVGALDPLTPGEVVAPVGDGLPEHLAEWVARDGLTHLKVKLNGDDLAWDVARVAAVEAVTAGEYARTGREPAWVYSLDFNEKCRDVQYLLDFFARLQESAPAAFGRVQYVEQPTARDLRANPANRMHAAAAVRPVVIDESLVDLASLKLALEQGYSGVALKTCKGQTAAVLLGAFAQKRGLFLTVQDLTCPGASFLHSAGLTARLPTAAAVEGNGRQYCPAANRGWEERFPTLFRPVAGRVETGRLTGPGLGH